MGYCTNCGAVLEDYAAFCIRCGAPIKQQPYYQNSDYKQPANNAGDTYHIDTKGLMIFAWFFTSPLSIYCTCMLSMIEAAQTKQEALKIYNRVKIVCIINAVGVLAFYGLLVFILFSSGVELGLNKLFSVVNLQLPNSNG